MIFIVVVDFILLSVIIIIIDMIINLIYY